MTFPAAAAPAPAAAYVVPYDPFAQTGIGQAQVVRTLKQVLPSEIQDCFSIIAGFAPVVTKQEITQLALEVIAANGVARLPQASRTLLFRYRDQITCIDLSGFCISIRENFRGRNRAFMPPLQFMRFCNNSRDRFDRLFGAFPRLTHLRHNGGYTVTCNARGDDRHTPLAHNFRPPHKRAAAIDFSVVPANGDLPEVQIDHRQNRLIPRNKLFELDSAFNALTLASSPIAATADVKDPVN